MSDVAKSEEGVPSEAGDIWLASPKESGVLRTGRGPAAVAQRRRGWPASANHNA